MTLPLYSYPASIPKTSSLGVVTVVVVVVAVAVKGLGKGGRRRDGNEQWSPGIGVCVVLSLRKVKVSGIMSFCPFLTFVLLTVDQFVNFS